MDEKELIDKLKKSDSQAFKIFINANKNKVFNVCYRFLNNFSDAEDAAQETFIEVFNSISRFNSKSSLNTWIYRIAVNKSIDALRKKSRRNKLAGFISIFSDDFKKKENTLFSDINPSTELETAETKQKVLDSINKLPENQRIALILIKLDGQSYKEAAAIMDITLPAVESLMIRAKNNLKKILEKENVFEK